jgi:hypothetical protein
MGRRRGTWICKKCHRANPLTKETKNKCDRCGNNRCEFCGKQGLGMIINADKKEVLIENNMFGQTAHSLTCENSRGINENRTI